MAIITKTKAKLKSKIDPANFFQTEVHQTTLLIQEEDPNQIEDGDDIYLGRAEDGVMTPSVPKSPPKDFSPDVKKSQL